MSKQELDQKIEQIVQATRKDGYDVDEGGPEDGVRAWYNISKKVREQEVKQLIREVIESVVPERQDPEPRVGNIIDTPQALINRGFNRAIDQIEEKIKELL